MFPFVTRFFRTCAGGPEARKAVRPAQRRCAFRPRLELLEDRTVPSTFTVLNLADSGAGSLRAAIEAAEADPGADVIDFANSVQGTIVLTGGELNITSDLTIDGPGAEALAVSGNATSRIFHVAGGADEASKVRVAISGLTITHGWAADAGGGIVNSGFSDLTLARVVLSNNVVVGQAGPNASGGAVHSVGEGARLHIVNSQVVGNTADGRNVLRGVGGGVAVEEGRLTVVNSTIADNAALGGAAGIAAGGGLRLLFATGSVTNSLILDNQSIGGPDGGEGIAGGIQVRFSSLVVHHSRLAGNQARGGDGGLFGQAIGGAMDNFGSVTISNSTVEDNRAVAGNGGANAGDDFSVGTAFGGAISNSGLLEITNSILRGNRAIGGDDATHSDAPNTADVGAAHGGAIFNAGGAEAVIRNSTITGNRALGGHGNTGNGPIAFVGTATGGGIDNSLDLFLFGEPSHQPARVTVINSTLSGNEAVGGNGNTGVGDQAFVGAGLGGGIANYLGAIAHISRSLLKGNRAIGGAGGLGAGGAIFNGIGTVPAAGGAIVVPTLVNVTRSTLEGNLAQGGAGSSGGNGLGGGAYNDATSSLTLTRSSVTKNSAQGGEADDGGSDGAGIGGGVYNLGIVDIDATLVFANEADEHDDCFGCP